MAGHLPRNATIDINHRVIYENDVAGAGASWLRTPGRTIESSAHAIRIGDVGTADDATTASSRHEDGSPPNVDEIEPGRRV